MPYEEEEDEEGSYAQAAEKEEDEEEYREVDPMAVIEERLMLLESWLQDDPYNEDVSAKLEEYSRLMEELEILGKKMRKTDKLLGQEQQNATTTAKLERKRDQYEREVTDIVLYAEQDEFFDVEGENGEAALNAYMKANSLLGRPLETLTEMSGFEDSKAWNDSVGALDYKSDTNHSRSPNTRKQRVGKNTFSDLDMSKPENVTILKKELKRVKTLFENSIDDAERTELLKKVTEYKEKLSTVKGYQPDDQSSDDDTALLGVSSHSALSEASIDVPSRAPVQAMAQMVNGGGTKTNRKNNTVKVRSKAAEEAEDEGYRLLKKKLTKATQMKQKTSDAKNLKKLQKKIDKYVSQLSGYAKWEQDQYTYGYGTSTALEEEEQEAEWLEQQAAADEERLAQEEQQQQDQLLRRSHAKTMLEGRKKNETEEDEASEPDNPDDDSLNLDKYVEEERKVAKLYRKKLKKVEQLIDQMLQKEGDEARYTKEFRKLQKKRKEYLKELGEDHASLSNLSVDMSVAPSVDLSASVGNMNVSLNMSSLNQSGLEASSGTIGHPEDDSEAGMLRKKLKKVKKMMKKAGEGTKEYTKLSKKKRQYEQEISDLES